MKQPPGITPAAVPRWLAALISLTMALIGVIALDAAPAPAAATPAASAGLEVYVGYADTLRAAPKNFPTPWQGSPGVVYQGCTGSCSFDGGAVRIVNDSTTVQTINAISLSVSTCTFAYWPSNTVLQPGQQLIIAQTASGATNGCDNTNGQMDTSDIGPNGVGWSGNCMQSGVIPTVNATIDGQAESFPDTKQVLNTGGIDLASCPPSTNESTQWSLIGTRCSGATLALAPVSQSQQIGKQASLEATLDNGCGAGLQGATVNFTIPSGPNAGKIGTGTTDANGVATFTYVSGTVGLDTVEAATTNPAGTIGSNTATVNWTKRSSNIEIKGGASTSDFHDAATVAASLDDNNGKIVGATISFSLNGIEMCSGVTNSSGGASCPVTPGEAAGSYTLTASYAGSAQDLPASATSTFTVTHEETTVTYTGPTQAANGAPLTLSGVLLEDGTTPIDGRTVTFTIGSGASAQSCSGMTDTTGSASCTISDVSQPASSTTVGVTAAFAGDAYYSPSSASATLNFEYLTGRAYGLSSSGLVGITPTPDTGNVVTSGAENVQPPCVISISGLISAGTLCTDVTTSLDPGTSSASSSVQTVGINVLGLPAIAIGAVQSSSVTNCAGSTGSTTIASLKVGGIPLNINIHPGANTTISVLGISITLNEQIPVSGPDKGLTVNAVHIKALGLLDIVVASSESDIGNC